jgi:hypothetical protein
LGGEEGCCEGGVDSQSRISECRISRNPQTVCRFDTLNVEDVAMRIIERGIKRRDVIEAYAKYDCSKKG